LFLPISEVVFSIDIDTVNDTKTIITELTIFAKSRYGQLGKFKGN
jgi:hypothetical protein